MFENFTIMHCIIIVVVLFIIWYLYNNQVRKSEGLETINGMPTVLPSQIPFQYGSNIPEIQAEAPDVMTSTPPTSTAELKFPPFTLEPPQPEEHSLMPTPSSIPMIPTSFTNCTVHWTCGQGQDQQQQQQNPADSIGPLWNQTPQLLNK